MMIAERPKPEIRRLAPGMETPALVLGGNVFGWTVDQARSFAILDAFVAAGGTAIDTADLYSAFVPGNGGGESEAIIGAWLQRRGRRDDVFIITKVGALAGEGGNGLQPSRIAAAVEASLRRLRTDYIDIYFAHKDDPATPQEETAAAFQKLIDQGKVRALGASSFAADRLASALEIAGQNGFTPYSVVQPELNLVRRDRYEGPVQDICVERGLAVITFFALASGFLTGKYRSDLDFSDTARASRAAKYADERGWAVLAAMDELVAETGATHAQVALAWNADQPGVVAPIASATSPRQLEELMGALNLKLTADQLSRLDQSCRSPRR